MRVIILLLGVLAATMGALAILAPGWPNRLARMFFDRPGFYVTTVIRLVLGTGLLVLAETSRAAVALRIFGANHLADRNRDPFSRSRTAPADD